MRSDTIHVTNEGDGIQKALDQVDLVGRYKGLDHKSVLHLRLLTEEMMGLLRGLTGQREASFWIEDEDSVYSLHLQTKAVMNAMLREQLLSVSSSGRNEAARGFMGKIRELFERASEPIDKQTFGTMILGMDHTGFAGDNMMHAAEIWTMSRYLAAMHEATESPEEWDELERSVVVRLADEVQVGIAGDTVELIIEKKLAGSV